MLKIGLTGGIGSGKSVVANIFRQLGVQVYDADKEARLLTEKNAELKKEILTIFGQAFFNKDKSLNRQALASHVFSDKQRLSQLNAIVHPFVREHFAKWLRQWEKKKYIIKEAAILFESSTYKELDTIISVE
ncbi:MAG: dephospho-CoA kinase, partial [Bacteroidia bacterium]|nr:dephospho-CoA kinase [Bacteroidia bacterium]